MDLTHIRELDLTDPLDRKAFHTFLQKMLPKHYRWAVMVDTNDCQMLSNNLNDLSELMTFIADVMDDLDGGHTDFENVPADGKYH